MSKICLTDLTEHTQEVCAVFRKWLHSGCTDKGFITQTNLITLFSEKYTIQTARQAQDMHPARHAHTHWVHYNYNFNPRLCYEY